MKKVQYTLIAIDAICIILVIAAFASPKEFGKKFLDAVGIKTTYTEIDHPNVVKNIQKDLYVDTLEHKRSDNPYEETIMNHDAKDIYKLVELTIDDYRAFMLIVYNPANVRLMVCNGFDTPNNTGKITVEDMNKKYGAVAGINGGGFFDNGEYTTDKPRGYIIKDGKIIWDEPGRIGNLIGFNNNNELVLMQASGEEAIKAGVRDAVEFGPYLIVEGRETPDSHRMAEAKASRVVIGQRTDGIVIMIATDGGSFNGPRMKYIVKTLMNYGVYNAANMDGGYSSQMVVNGKNYTVVNDKMGIVTTSGRRVVNGWGVIDND